MSSETPLRIVFVGHVDHGKSTLIGRLFYDTNSLPEGKYEQIRDTCQRRGVPFEWAFLMDALQAEREQNITIDTSQIWFRSQGRPYTIIDAPGHKEFLKNMITGAASADAAVLLIAADEGVQEQSRRHGHMLSMLGIDQVAVVVNKMDLVDYDRQTYERIVGEYAQFLKKLGIEPRQFIPVSAREGDQVAAAIGDRLAWYEGPSVVEILARFEAPKAPTDRPLRLPLQDIYRFDEQRILAGRVESGQLEVGQELIFEPGHKRGVVRTIEGWQVGPDRDVGPGDSVGITLEEQIFVERGHVAAPAEAPPAVTRQFVASVFWMGNKDLIVDEPYRLKLATQEVECRIREIKATIDGSTLEAVADAQKGRRIARFDVARVVIETRYPVALDLASEHPALGRFVIVDGYDIAGGGIVVEILDLQAQQEISDEPVARGEREGRRGHRGAVISLGGEGAAEGAPYLERALFDAGIDAVYLDGGSPKLLAQLGLVAIVVAPNDSPGLVVDDEVALPLPADGENVGGLVADLVAYLRR